MTIVIGYAELYYLLIGASRALALDKIAKTLHKEVHRLKALRLVNPNVRAEEIEFFEQELRNLSEIMASTSLRLDAIRVIVAT